MPDMVKLAKRQAMLDAQTKWLEEAAKAETLTLKTVARVIADAFGKEAEEYKEDISTRTEGWGWSDETTGRYDSDGDDERGAPLVLFEEGGGV